MRTSSLLGHVVELLDLVRAGREPADAIASDFFRARRYLGSKDRRYIAEFVYGVLRHYRLLEVFVSETFSRMHRAGSQGALSSIALCAAYAVKLLQEPGGTLIPGLSGLFRMYLPDVDCGAFLGTLAMVALPPSLRDDPARLLAVEHSHPDSVVREWIERFGFDEAVQLCRASNQPAPITVRVNTLKCSVDECRHALQHEGIETTPTRLAPCGLILDRRVNVHALRSFRDGWFELQDEGSQLIAMVVEPSPGETVVDACAGGGGKTLHLAALMKNLGVLVSVDLDERRLKNLRGRAGRAGVTMATVMRTGPDLFGSYRSKADAVLVDAPCSGVGTFRRNPGAKLKFSEDFVSTVCRTQRRLLEDSAELVKPGGRLVYATCSLLRQENETAVESFLSKHTEFALQHVAPILRRHAVTVDDSTPFLLLLPHRTTTDGFFAAAMIRNLS